MQNEGSYGIEERDEVDADSSPRTTQLSRCSTVIRTESTNVNVKAENFGQSLVHSLPDSPGMQDER
jgi:hypothetical protein